MGRDSENGAQIELFDDGFLKRSCEEMNFHFFTAPFHVLGLISFAFCLLFLPAFPFSPFPGVLY